MTKPFFYFIITLTIIMGTVSAETALVVDSGKNITFNASSISAFSNLTLSTASWDFADDTTDEGITTVHSFTYEGVYNVIIEAQDSQGGKHTASLPVVVGGSVPIVPSDATYVAVYFTNKPAGIFTLTVNQSASSSTSTANFLSIGKFFEISSSMANGQFTARLVFSYDDQDDDGIVDGTSVSENTLGPYYYDGSWKLIPSTINTNANLITADVDHFTEFAILSSSSQSSTPSTGDGGGGGGGGGGGFIPSNASNKTNQTTAPVSGCQESWTCSDWSACVNETQTRACRDANNCGTSGAKPSAVQTCSLGNETNQVKSEISSSNEWMIGLVVGVIVVVLVIYALMRRRLGLAKSPRMASLRRK